MESQWSDCCNDPRIAPHLQTLADQSFSALIKIACSVGVDVVNAPFDEMDENIGNTWKACIAEFLVALLPPPIADRKPAM
jgi:hypothetical protein